jgi:hypothetical protein
MTDPEYPDYIPRYTTNPSTGTLALAPPPKLLPVPQQHPEVITSRISLLQRNIMVSPPEIDITMEQMNTLLGSVLQAPSP